MKKSFLCFGLILAFTLFNALPVAACWMQPESFEIVSDNGNKVFVFTPAEDGMSSANAAVYEIIGTERQLVYSVEDLSSFAYESNFHFSSDMTHFARIFPPYGIETFEVFSNGVRTRVVMRSDFIEDYASIEAETSIGPSYSVNWMIEEHLQNNATIAINTDESSTVFFDLTTAKFSTESEAPIIHETPSGLTPPQILQTETSRTIPIIEAPPEVSTVSIAETQSASNMFFVILGFAVVFIVAVVFLLKKWMKAK